MQTLAPVALFGCLVLGVGCSNSNGPEQQPPFQPKPYEVCYFPSDPDAGIPDGGASVDPRVPPPLPCLRKDEQGRLENVIAGDWSAIVSGPTVKNGACCYEVEKLPPP